MLKWKHADKLICLNQIKVFSLAVEGAHGKLSERIIGPFSEYLFAPENNNAVLENQLFLMTDNIFSDLIHSKLIADTYIPIIDSIRKY